MQYSARDSRISSAVLIHTNGLWFLFHSVIHLRMSVSSSVTLRCAGAAQLAGAGRGAGEGGPAVQAGRCSAAVEDRRASVRVRVACRRGAARCSWACIR